MSLAQTEPNAGRQKVSPSTSQVYEIKVSQKTSSRIADILSGIVKGIKAAGVGDRIVISVGDDVPQQMLTDIRGLVPILDKVLNDSALGEEDPKAVTGIRVQSVYHVDAKSIASALNNSIENINVKSVGSNLLVIIEKSGRHIRSIDDIRRHIALLDMPRPMVGLQIWAFQLSAKDDDNVRKASILLSEIINELDQQIVSAFDRGWAYIRNLFVKDGKERKRSDWTASISVFNPIMYDYLTQDVSCDEGDTYCLRYLVSENAYPSMAKMLVALALLKKPEKHIRTLLCKMESSAQDSADSISKSQSRAQSAVDDTSDKLDPPKFPHFSRALNRLYEGHRHRLLQAAVADFLFNYKWSSTYPKKFSPYNYSRSADQLNSLFSPVFEGFLRDLREYVDGIESCPRWSRVKKKLGEERLLKTGLLNSGVIRVATLSGTEARVEAHGISYFDVARPLDLAGLRKNMNLQSEKFLTHLGGIPSHVLSLLASAVNVKPSVFEVTRGVKLTVLPQALRTGSAAELDVKLEVGEGDAAPQNVSAESTVMAIDRVAKHALDTKVRLETLRLFEVSTFLNHVTRPIPDRPVPIIGQLWHAVFGAIPGLNRLFVFRQSLETVYHQSVVWVQAVVVPTAIDLGWSLEFRRNRIRNDKGSDQWHKIIDIREEFHREMRRYLILPRELRGVKPKCSDNCNELKQSPHPETVGSVQENSE